MKGKRQSGNEVRENVVKKLSGQMAERNDKKIAQEIHEGKEIEAVSFLSPPPYPGLKNKRNGQERIVIIEDRE